MRICATNAIVPFTEISVLNDGTSEEIKVVSDRKGRFSFKLIPGYYTIKVLAISGQLETPMTYLGDGGNFLRMDLYLATHEVLINEMRDPRLRKELKKLRKEMEREERKGSRHRK